MGAGEDGAIRLPNAHLGTLQCTNVRVHNQSGPAIMADGMQVDDDVTLGHETDVTGDGDMGAIRLLGARLSALQCDDLRVRNDSGPGIVADFLHVDRTVQMRNEVTVAGTGDLGAIRMIGAQLRSLDCAGATVSNDSGPALVAVSMRVEGNLLLTGEFVGGGDEVLDLNHTKVDGVLVLAPAELEHHTNPQALLNVNELVYSGLPLGMSTDDWLWLLQEGTAKYAAQPYQQLASAHRGAGHDREARRVLMAQRRDQIRRALTGRTERAWARFTGLTLGYGYQPWRALIGLLAVVTTAVVLAVVLGGQGGLAQVRTPPSSTAADCTVVERIGVGLDLGTPLISTGAGSGCETAKTTVGQILIVTGWALQLMAWAFATLFIAGFTGAVRKT